MSYTTTSVSRRQFAAQAKPGQRQAKPPPAPPVSRDSGAAKAAVPELFQRSSFRRIVRPVPTPWWKTGVAFLLANVVALAVFGGIYAWSDADREENRAFTPRRTPVRPPSSNNARPAESSRPLATARQASVGSSGGRTPAGDSASVEQALLDGRGKLVLPANVSGDCRIGEGGSKDFGRCLVENGARAE